MQAVGYAEECTITATGLKRECLYAQTSVRNGNIMLLSLLCLPC